MRFPFRSLCLGVFLCAGLLGDSSSDLSRGEEARAAAIWSLLAPWGGPNSPGAAVVVSQEGKVVAQFMTGMADLEQGVPVSPASVFHAASLSKQFTAYAVLLLEQEGRLSLDDPLSRHLPEARVWGPITLRQLLHHTGGLREQWTLLELAGWRREDLVTDDQVLALLFRQRSGNVAPGLMFQYSNTGYSLLAEVVRRVSGQSLRAFCEARMFSPLGMAHTRFQDDLSEIVPGRVQSYRQASGGYARMPLNYATAGPSGLLTTAEDLSRWARHLEAAKGGALGLVQRMQEQGILADGTVIPYAMGQERRPYKGFDTWSHGGRDAGFRSFLLRVPEARFSVAVLSNAADFDTAKVAFAVADQYLSGHPSYRPAAPESGAPSPAQLAAYSGDYELFPGLIFHLSTDGRRLFLGQLGGSDAQELPARSDRAFSLDPRSDTAIEFDEPGTSGAAQFRYRIGQHGSLVAKRVALKPFSARRMALRDFEGRYFSRELEVEYELVVAQGRLESRNVHRPAVVLRPYQADVFLGEPGPQKIVFKRNAAGRVVGFTLSGALAEGIRFVRRP